MSAPALSQVRFVYSLTVTHPAVVPADDRRHVRPVDRPRAPSAPHCRRRPASSSWSSVVLLTIGLDIGQAVFVDQLSANTLRRRGERLLGDAVHLPGGGHPGAAGARPRGDRRRLVRRPHQASARTAARPGRQGPRPRSAPGCPPASSHSAPHCAPSPATCAGPSTCWPVSLLVLGRHGHRRERAVAVGAGRRARDGRSAARRCRGLRRRSHDTPSEDRQHDPVVLRLVGLASGTAPDARCLVGREVHGHLVGVT